MLRSRTRKGATVETYPVPTQRTALSVDLGQAIDRARVSLLFLESFPVRVDQSRLVSIVVLRLESGLRHDVRVSDLFERATIWSDLEKSLSKR